MMYIKHMIYIVYNIYMIYITYLDWGEHSINLTKEQNGKSNESGSEVDREVRVLEEDPTKLGHHSTSLKTTLLLKTKPWSEKDPYQHRQTNIKSRHGVKMIAGHLNILPLWVAKVVSRQKIKPVSLFLIFKATWSFHLCNSDSCKTVLKCQVLIIAKLSVFAITNHFISMGPLGKALFLLSLWKMTKNRGFPMWPFVLGVFQGHGGRATEAGGENDECVPCVPMRNPILRTRPPTNLLTILLVEFGNLKKEKHF